jgi:hypothetical protein
VNDLRVQACLEGVEVVALGFDELGGSGYVVGFGGAVCGHRLMVNQPSSLAIVLSCCRTFVLASGSTKRCFPRDFTNVRDLCASTATLRSDDVLPAFFLECLWFGFF